MRTVVCLIFLLALCLLFPSYAETDAQSWYEIFVRSYADTDGDGIGDLQGVKAHLSQLSDLGFDGIWLMPVMPSPSYHKYDVTDYCAIDAEYGTLEDMRELVSACHDYGIRIIIDLPINHTSTQHPWFIRATQALKKGDADDPYADYYHFSSQSGPKQVPLEGTMWYYEEQFSGGSMPDLNLDSENLWQEIQQILRFWLSDIGVDGFRLDAVTSYVTGDTQKNVAILNRLKSLAETIRPGCFFVGEAWTNLQEIQKYYTSGIDAFFLFPISQAEGWLCRSLRARNPAQKYAGYLEDLYSTLPDVQLAPFLSNHDTGRAVPALQARTRPGLVKFAHLVLNLTGGAVFTYYGEEIGMIGSGDDPNKRLAMYWNDSDMTLQPPGTTSIEYVYPSFDDQYQDPDSLLLYFRSINRLKKAYPLISSGKTSIIYSDAFILVLKKEQEGRALYLVLNFSGKEEKSTVLPENTSLSAQLCTEGAVQVKDGNLFLPPYSLAVLE